MSTTTSLQGRVRESPDVEITTSKPPAACETPCEAAKIKQVQHKNQRKRQLSADEEWAVKALLSLPIREERIRMFKMTKQEREQRKLSRDPDMFRRHMRKARETHNYVDRVTWLQCAALCGESRFAMFNNALVEVSAPTEQEALQTIALIERVMVDGKEIQAKEISTCSAKRAHGQDIIGRTGGVAKKGDGPMKGRKGTKIVKRKEAPAAVGYTSRSRAPTIMRHADKIVVKHREFLNDIVSDPANEFAYDVYRINPADADTFPWLAALANQYESYKFLKLSFEYIPGCGSSQGGHCIMAVDYDSADPTDQTTKQQMLAWASSTSGQMWEKQVMVCRPADLHKIGPTRFVASVQSSTTAESALQDAGNFYIATTQTNGLTLNGTNFFNQVELGQLWVSYEVELLTPQLNGATLSASAFPEKNGPVLPQFALDLNGFAASFASVAAAVNPLNAVPTGLMPPQGVLNPVSNTVATNLDAFGISLVRTLVSQLITSAGGAIPAGETILRFAKDFEGYLGLSYLVPQGWVAQPTNLFLETLLPVNNAGSTAVNQISTPTNRTDALQNAALPLATVSSTIAYTTLYKLKAVAGSFIRMLSATGDFRTSAGGLTSLKLNCASSALSKAALMGMKPLGEAPVSYEYTGGRKPTREQMRIYLDWKERKDQETAATSAATTSDQAFGLLTKRQGDGYC